MTESGYFEGEEESVPRAPAYQAFGFPRAPALAPFPSRKLPPHQVPWDEWTSPKKKFRGASKELSIALGAQRNTPTGLGGHPFELERQKLAPGDAGCPFHIHSAQWEMFLIMSGRALIRANEETQV